MQITLDGGDTWNTAEITYPGTRLTWAQWVYNFVPKEADDFTATVRCIDGLGGIQSDVKHGPDSPVSTESSWVVDAKGKVPQQA